MRRLLPLLALFCLAAPATGGEALPEPREVFDAYLEAVGGREAVLAQEHMTLHGTFSVPAQGVQGPMTVYASAPDHFLLAIDIPGLGQVKTGFDGEHAWSIDPLSGPQVLEEDAFEDMKEEADFYDILKEPGDYESFETLGTEEIDGRACWVVRLVRTSGREAVEYYDAGTGLLLAADATQATPMGVVQVRTRIEEHADFGGVLHPSRMSQSMMGMDQVFTFDRADLEPIPAETFAPPAEIRVLLEEHGN